jgi:SAM-dependent methyltransferase
MQCRLCAAPLSEVFLDLGAAPLSNAYLRDADLQRAEKHFPLKLFTCTSCWLVQVDEFERAEVIFGADYAYFSSFSKSWLAHAERFVGKAVQDLHLGKDSLVVEVASNDGYLLQYVKARGIPCIGIEPTAGTAAAAREIGVQTEEIFLGAKTAQEFVSRHGRADLVVGNNVFAHVPDLSDFVAGLSTLLAPGGTLSLEFPHLLRMVRENQFDTVYHEHFSYLSLHAASRALATHGLAPWRVEELPTHGGSLRVWARHAATCVPEPSVEAVLQSERDAGMLAPAFYARFQQQAERVKNDFVSFLIEQKRAGRRVAAYGAAAKGNTLINFAGIRPDLLQFVVDASPHKQGRYLPGSRIPIVGEHHLHAARPDFVVLLPWNLREELTVQLAYINHWGGKLVVAVPHLELLPPNQK